MTKLSQLLDFDVAALSQKLRAKEISPIELTQAYLDRIDAVDERIVSYITVTADVARETARKAEAEITAGRWRGPFHGVPIGLKDLCYTKGILTTGGSKILGEFVPDHDSTVWTRVRRAGRGPARKPHPPRFALGPPPNHPPWGPLPQPLRPQP